VILNAGALGSLGFDRKGCVPFRPFSLITTQPFVAGLPTDLKIRAQLGQRKLPGRGQTDESMHFFRGRYLVSGHSLRIPRYFQWVGATNRFKEPEDLTTDGLHQGMNPSKGGFN
jgi:hypothetical protein